MKSLMRLLWVLEIYLVLFFSTLAHASLVVGGIPVDEAYSLYAEDGSVVANLKVGIIPSAGVDDIVSAEGTFFDGANSQIVLGICPSSPQFSDIFVDGRPHFEAPGTCLDIGGGNELVLEGIGNFLYYGVGPFDMTQDQFLDIANPFKCFDGGGGTGPIGTPECHPTTTVGSVPEPTSTSLVAVALGGMFFVGRRRRLAIATT